MYDGSNSPSTPGTTDDEDVFFYKRKNSVQIDPDTKRIVFNSTSRPTYDGAIDSFEQLENRTKLNSHTLDRLRSMSPNQQAYWMQKLMQTDASQHEIALRMAAESAEHLETLAEYPHDESSCDIDFEPSMHKKSSKKSSSRNKSNQHGNGCTVS